MEIQRIRGRLLLFGWFACAMVIAAQDKPAASVANWTEDQKEEFLRDAKVVSRKEIGEGVTNSMHAVLEKDGVTHDAHIQCIDVSKTEFQSTRGTEMNFKDTFKFNVAAYGLAELLGIDDMIPPSIERKEGGKTCAFTWWLDDVMMEETQRNKKNITPPDLDSWNKEMYVVRVFDQLIFNTDRNLGNLLITKDWRIWMIDHTRAFRIRRDLQNPKNLADTAGVGKCDRQLLAKLRELDKNTLKQKLGKYLTGMEIDGVIARRNEIVKFFDNQIKKNGEAEVLYDRPSRKKA